MRWWSDDSQVFAEWWIPRLIVATSLCAFALVGLVVLKVLGVA